MDIDFKQEQFDLLTNDPRKAADPKFENLTIREKQGVIVANIQEILDQLPKENRDYHPQLMQYFWKEYQAGAQNISLKEALHIIKGLDLQEELKKSQGLLL